MNIPASSVLLLHPVGGLRNAGGSVVYFWKLHTPLKLFTLALSIYRGVRQG